MLTVLHRHVLPFCGFGVKVPISEWEEYPGIASQSRGRHVVCCNFCNCKNMLEHFKGRKCGMGQWLETIQLVNRLYLLR